MLTVIDEFSRECLAIVVARPLRADDVLQVLADLFIERGPPDHIGSDNEPEFAAKAVRNWPGRVGVKTLFIEPRTPWENGYNESFNGKLRDELLGREIFCSLREAEVLTSSKHCFELVSTTTRSGCTVHWVTGPYLLEGCLLCLHFSE
jgi:transposase InsO family protein